MEAVKYSEKYTATLGPADERHFVLDLAPRDALDELLASGLAIRVATIPAPHDPDSYIRQFGPEAAAKQKVAREAAYEIRTASYDLGEMAENLAADARFAARVGSLAPPNSGACICWRC